MSSPRFRVAVCGGGVGGLTLAVALSRYPDLQVDIYERARSFSEVGAGIVFMLRPFKVIRKLGKKLEEALLGKLPVPFSEESSTGFRFRKSDQPEGETLFDMVIRGSLINLHRADFQGVLLDNLGPNVKTHTSKRLHSYSQSDDGTLANTLAFEDGTTATCDILVGADGVRSAVRAKMMQDLARDPTSNSSGEMRALQEYLACIEPVFSGVIAHRALIPAEKLRAVAPSHRAFGGVYTWVAKGRVITTYPVSMGKFVNLAANSLDESLMRSAHSIDANHHQRYDGDWVKSITKDDFLDKFEGMEKEVQTMLDLIESGNAWVINVTKNLPTHVHGRVALLGDAAHAMTPFLGSGAGQAVEDAYMLSELLGDYRVTLATLSHALTVYDEIRRPFSTNVARLSMENGFTAGLQSGTPISDMEERVNGAWSWAWETEIDDSMDEARKLLGKRLGA